jgi:hypothetical protein
LVPGEEVENNLTLLPYLGEGLYKGLVSLRGDVVPGEEVEKNPLYSLTMVRVCI